MVVETSTESDTPRSSSRRARYCIEEPVLLEVVKILVNFITWHAPCVCGEPVVLAEYHSWLLAHEVYVIVSARGTKHNLREFLCVCFFHPCTAQIVNKRTAPENRYIKQLELAIFILYRTLLYFTSTYTPLWNRAEHGKLYFSTTILCVGAQEGCSLFLASR